MFGPGKEFLGVQSTTIFFFFQINGSSKESKSLEAHPRIFFLTSSFPMTCVNPIEVFFTGSFFFFASTESPCGNLDFIFSVQILQSNVVDLEASAKKFDCDNCSS
jgi:hypothetical protein